MKRFLAFLVRLLAVASVGLMPIVSHAAEYAEWGGGAPYDTPEGVMGGLEMIADNLTLFFGVVVVLAILVTGFFLGRKWLRRVG